jgi:putative nucleotidyltransferase with HDIG domain
METPRCPGQDQRFWKPQDIFDVTCPWCGEEIEFWKDEPVRVCTECEKEVRNPRMDLGCAKWCKFAQDCLGDQLADHIGEMSIRDQLIGEMRAVFGEGSNLVDHTSQVLEYAERILETEGGDSLVVRGAAILHDIGIPAAQEKHGSSDGPYQEQEGPPIARAILEKLCLNPDEIEHICKIIASHHSGEGVDTPEFRIVWDADWLVNLAASSAEKTREELTADIDRLFRTARGRELATRRYLAAI